jgi:hypothetical protein
MRRTNLDFRFSNFCLYQENAMNAPNRNRATIRTIFPVVLRITFSLILWTLGAASMVIASPHSNEHRSVYNFPVERAKLEDLQRWVNAGHDPWCRDPQLVAASSLQRVLADSSDIELASLALELERNQKTSAVYTFHSLDGLTAYRVTVRRYRWLRPLAGSQRKTIWVPERLEIITHAPRVPYQDVSRSASA